MDGGGPQIVEVKFPVRLDGVERSGSRQRVQFGAAHEASGLVGLVKLHGVDQLPSWAAPTFEVLVVVTDGSAGGVQHEVAAYQSRRVGQAVGVLVIGREQQ